MTYQPDPAAVRAIADRIIHTEIDNIRDLGVVDVSEMAEDELEALYATFGDDLKSADDAADTLIDAVRKDISAATIAATWTAP